MHKKEHFSQAKIKYIIQNYKERYQKNIKLHFRSLKIADSIFEKFMNKQYLTLLLLFLTLFPSVSSARVLTVVMNNYKFVPNKLTIHKNDTVKWVHQQRNRKHDVDSKDGISFQSPDLFYGNVFTHKFSSPGNFPYHCSFHHMMTGTITVKP